MVVKRNRVSGGAGGAG